MALGVWLGDLLEFGQILLAIIRKGWKKLEVENTLAYYIAKNTAVKCFYL
jgi:hypothetical protein